MNKLLMICVPALLVGCLLIASSAEAVFISADGVTDTSHFRNGSGSVELFPEALINGAGLDVLSAAGIHEGDFGSTQTPEGRNLWHAGVPTAGDSTGVGTAAANVAGQYLDFSFDTAVDLTDIHIWQYSQNGQSTSGRGTATFTLWASPDTAANLVQIGGTLSLVQSPFDDKEPVQTFDLVASGVKLVRLDILTDHGGNTNNYVGLDEVHFEAIPEPSSFALVGLGLLGIGFASRRKK